MSKRMITRIQQKLEYMGLRVDAKIFVYMRLISSLILFLIAFFTSQYGYIVAPLITIIYYFMIEYLILDLGVKRHIRDIENDALDFFPLFLIHLRGVRNVKKALYFTTNLIDNDLSRLFVRMLDSVDVGKSFDEAMKEIQVFIPSEYVNNIVTSIMEINRVGVNNEEAIKYQLNILEDKKEKTILNRLAIVPIKMAVVSVLFVFLMIIILIFLNLYLP